MTASVTLSKSSFEDSCFCNESSRRKYASRSQVYGIVQEHNQSGGNRLLNRSRRNPQKHFTGDDATCRVGRNVRLSEMDAVGTDREGNVDAVIDPERNVILLC